ncbi:acetylxylan esterase A [Pestalotiopsis fici W106-1]|uniref:Carboxylic ester hydrolase n=1 Tax=Pestalotiopsis fici (strain W106-1 / CGMCC3.15140) TaxID=1229662 RepID=W3WMW7_PESFW|nr:acetylxylan esterase A [Pestalotiopsis fici W106-1]ETS75124.1 acetylxylan esterase A [Pestalotiopsis fici W106-1]
MFLKLITLLLLAITSQLAASGPTQQLSKRASLTQVTNFGENASGTLMYIYVPNNLATNPAIVVAIHYCTGTASAYYTNTPYATLAEQYGFIVIYPQSPYSGTCWDVSSAAALTHDGGADSESIANMVTYTISTYGADASRVFVTGSSSGAMMTNVLAATYPEMFAAGVAYSGVPAGCFYTGTVDGWNSTCSQGQVVESQAYWTSVVENMYPGYQGARPRMRIHHGSVDTTLLPQNYNETIKQWTGVFGYSDTPQQTLPNDPASPYTRYIYGENVEGVYGTGIGHTAAIFGDADMEWFGIA